MASRSTLRSGVHCKAIFDLLFLLLRVAAVITLLCAAVAAQRGRGRPALAIGAIAYLAIVAVVGRE